MKTQIPLALQRLLFTGLLVFISSFMGGCGVRAVALTAEDFMPRDEIAVYSEKGQLLPHPDCLAYTKLSVTPTGDMVQDLITLGKRYLGKPYRYRGAAPWAFDCSGYVRFLYGSFGITLPASSSAISAATTPVDNPMPGDLVFFKGRNRKSNRVGHVALVIEVKKNGAIIMMHSTNQRGIVIEEIEKSRYFSSRYLGARRIPKLYSYFEAKKEQNEEQLQTLPPTFVHGTLVPQVLLTPKITTLKG